MKCIDFDMGKLPVWVLTKRGMSCIASALGTTLYMNNIATSKKRNTFAKVYMKVGANLGLLMWSLGMDLWLLL